MKIIRIFVSVFLFFFLMALPVTGYAAVRVIKLHTEKVGDKMHWMPETVEVTEGETVKIQASHEAPGGFEFHGLKIEALKIETSVDRAKPFEVEKKIDLKPGAYDIACQFHPSHQAAKLVVKPKPALKSKEEVTSPVRSRAKAKNK